MNRSCLPLWKST